MSDVVETVGIIKYMGDVQCAKCLDRFTWFDEGETIITMGTCQCGNYYRVRKADVAIPCETIHRPAAAPRAMGAGT